MWMANSATHIINDDSGEHYFFISNLYTHLHRRYEYLQTFDLYSQFFNHPISNIKLVSKDYPDEGAANSICFSSSDSTKNLYLFVYGYSRDRNLINSRQSRAAFEFMINSTNLPEKNFVLAKQSQSSIENGVFHNDVISFGAKDLFVYHERAFDDSQKIVNELSSKFNELTGNTFRTFCVLDKDLPLNIAIKSYFFNSQIAVVDRRFYLFLS